MTKSVRVKTAKKILADENTGILERIAKVMGPKTQRKKTRDINLSIASLIFEAVMSDTLAKASKQATWRKYVITTREQRDQQISEVRQSAAKIGAQTVLKRFSEKSWYQRWLCAFKGRID